MSLIVKLCFHVSLLQLQQQQVSPAPEKGGCFEVTRNILMLLPQPTGILPRWKTKAKRKHGSAWALLLPVPVTGWVMMGPWSYLHLQPRGLFGMGRGKAGVQPGASQSSGSTWEMNSKRNMDVWSSLDDHTLIAAGGQQSHLTTLLGDMSMFVMSMFVHVTWGKSIFIGFCSLEHQHEETSQGTVLQTLPWQEREACSASSTGSHPKSKTWG